LISRSTCLDLCQNLDRERLLDMDSRLAPVRRNALAFIGVDHCRRGLAAAAESAQ
jgi:hypothetical protein